MKKTHHLLSIVILNFFAITLSASAQVESPIFNSNQNFKIEALNKTLAQATELIELAQTSKTKVDFENIKIKNESILVLGNEIMDLYSSKNSKCSEQFNQFKKLIPEAFNLTLEQIEDLYHDAHGLIEAPRHCYLGRSQSVHALMNASRLSGEFSEETKERVIEDYNEIIDHLTKIEKNIFNPIP